MNRSYRKKEFYSTSGGMRSDGNRQRNLFNCKSRRSDLVLSYAFEPKIKDKEKNCPLRYLVECPFLLYYF